MRIAQKLQNKTLSLDIGNTSMQFVFGVYQTCEKMYQMQKNVYLL